MSDAREEAKDDWSQVQKWAGLTKIVMEISIAIAALSFTVIYNQKQEEVARANLQLAESNTKAAETQVISQLLRPLTSGEPRERAMALYLARALDESFTLEAARLYSLHDPSQDVRKTAQFALGSLAGTGSAEIKSRAETSLIQYQLMDELRERNLLDKLRQAHGYLGGANLSGKERALQLYREVVKQLPSGVRDRLGPQLLEEAESDYRSGLTDDALRKYWAIFSDYY